jgi:hypothetical protein
MTKITVILKPGAKPEDVSSTGAVSEISWKSAEPYLRALFKTTPKETIVGLELTENSIKAKFETK